MNPTGERETVYQLNRLYVIFSRPMLQTFLWLLGVYLLMLLVWWQSDVFMENGIWGTGLALLGFYFLCLLYKPKRFSVGQGRICFREYMTLHDRFRRGGRWVRVDYAVCDVRDLEFRQNSFERFFDAGHISFTGRVSLDTPREGDLEKIELPKTFVIYGIPNFSLFQVQFRLDT